MVLVFGLDVWSVGTVVAFRVVHLLGGGRGEVILKETRETEREMMEKEMERQKETEMVF